MTPMCYQGHDFTYGIWLLDCIIFLRGSKFKSQSVELPIFEVIGFPIHVLC